MVRFTVLASGSQGNSALLTHCPGGAEHSEESTRILIDAGLSCREIFRRMALAGEDPTRLDAILITHEHQDHISGLAVTARRLGIPVYFTEATHRAWLRQVTPRRRIPYAEWIAQYRRDRAPATSRPEDVAAGNTAAATNPAPPPTRSASSLSNPSLSNPSLSNPPLPIPSLPVPSLPKVEYFRPGQPFSIGGIGVSPFTIPHDAADPVGFVFSAEGVRVAVATDLGYLPPNVQAQLRRCDLLMLESNHDLEMLRDGPYPWQVKQRVLSRVGHLSNAATAAFLEETYDGAATYLILAHLSESNNLPQLARIAAERALVSKPSLLANRLYLAPQHQPLEPVCF